MAKVAVAPGKLTNCVRFNRLMGNAGQFDLISKLHDGRADIK